MNAKPYLNLSQGSHKNASQGMCVMEAAAYFVGEKHSDRPECTCRVIGQAMMNFNDRFPFKNDAERTETLLPLIPVVVGTRTNREDEIKRGFIAADFAARVFLTMRLKARGLDSEAERLKALPPIKDKASAIAARDLVRKLVPYAYDAYAAAAYDAYDAYDAYGAAAAAAAYDAYDAYAADAKTIKEAIKIAFAEMIKAMAMVGRTSLELSFEAKAEFEAACEVVCKK